MTDYYDDAPQIAERPWGAWKVVHQEHAGTVKVLTVNPGAMLSLQSHEHRDEFWVPLVSGLIAYTRGATPYSSSQAGKMLRAYEVFRVDRNYLHRLINPTEMHISLVEIINGKYDENDITRYHDSYGRLERN